MRRERLLAERETAFVVEKQEWLKKVYSLASKGHIQVYIYTHDAKGRLRCS